MGVAQRQGLLRRITTAKGSRAAALNCPLSIVKSQLFYIPYTLSSMPFISYSFSERST